MRTIAITVDGVLRAEVGQTMIPAGKFMTLALADDFNIALLLDDDKINHLEGWLLSEGFPITRYLLGKEVGDPDGGQGRALQLQRLATMGCAIEAVIEPDPEISAHLMGQGYTVLHYMHPTYSRPEFRPDWDGSIRPWDQIEAEAIRLRALRAADARIRAEN